MKRIGIIYCVMLLAGLAVALHGCGSKAVSMPGKNRQEDAVRLIALMPIVNYSEDSEAADILRTEINRELYFKGYPVVPLETVDSALSRIPAVSDDNHFLYAPEKIGSALGVDAVLYCTLSHWDTSYRLVYAHTRVSLSFELRCARTGRLIWKAEERDGKRCFDFTRKGLEIKAMQVYESIALNVVGEALATLPNGPNL